MLYSGRVLDFDDPTVIDKHSTGGVGDKTSFIIAPIAAACGVKVPMIAGRGLAHTGGTVDKIESIKGFQTSLDLDEFSNLLKRNGQVLIGQTSEIAPADKIIYALRDVSGTVESVELITASIMSKKLAEGASGIVMDVKTGSGAFMSTLSRAKALAKSLTETAVRFDKNIMTIISDMSQPLGNYIGNSLEIIESIETLKGNGPKDLTELSLQLAGGMIYIAGLSKTHKAGIKKAKDVLKSGKALEKFKELIEAQGGDSNFVDDYSLFPTSETKTIVNAEKSGYISSIGCKEFGLFSVQLGGGRKKAGEEIDLSVGFVLHKKVGDKVKAGEPLVTIHHHHHQNEIVSSIINELKSNTVKIRPQKGPQTRPLIFEIKEKWSSK
jgi:pyrimidine-nucleoside phosphorylase